MINLQAKGKRLVNKIKKEKEKNNCVVYVPPHTKWKRDIMGFDAICFREDGIEFVEGTVKSGKSARLKRIKDNPFFQRFKNIYRFEMYLWDSKKKKFLIEKI